MARRVADTSGKVALDAPHKAELRRLALLVNTDDDVRDERVVALREALFAAMRLGLDRATEPWVWRATAYTRVEGFAQDAVAIILEETT